MCSRRILVAPSAGSFTDSHLQVGSFDKHLLRHQNYSGMDYPPYPPFLDLLPRYALPINIGIFSTPPPPHFQYFEDGGVQTMDQIINATILFNNSNVNITVEGQRHLDAVVGSENSKPEYVNELVRD